MSEFGLESCFNLVNTEYNAVCKLDATHCVVAYKDTGGAGYGCAKVGVIDGNTVTWGAENVFNSATTDYISITALDSTHFVVGYDDAGGDHYGCARVGLVSGTTISSYGAENIFSSAWTYYPDVAALDSTHFVVGYYSGTDGSAAIGLVSGTTISSYGSANVFNAASSVYMSIAVLDSTHFAVVYKDIGNSNHGTAIIGLTNGGTTISSYGSENVFNAANTEYISASALDNTHFVVSYLDWGNSGHGTGIVGLTDGGTTISSYGSENVFNAAAVIYTSVSALDSTHFVVIYEDDGGSDYGCARQGTVSATTISSYDTEQTFNSAITVHISVAALSSTDYVVVYKDDGGADYGCGRIWGSSGWSGTIIGVSSPAKVMGIAVADITSVVGVS